MLDPPATFGLRTPQDLIAKLGRELVRLNAARNPEDMIDHGLNFAISAWHMADWIAKLQNPTADNKKLRKKVETLQIIACTKCPELENCRVIATFAKYLVCTRPHRDQTFKANEAPAEIVFVNNRNEPVTCVNNDGDPITWISSLCIVQGADRRQAVETFNAVFEWWRSFVEMM